MSPAAPPLETLPEHRLRSAATSAGSARSLLLTIFGEFAHPHGGRAWTGSLVDALGLVGVEERSARQAISRSASEGLLEPERHGRRVRWGLTESGRALLDEGVARVSTFMRQPRRWDGRWLVASVAVPEAQRSARHELRNRLTWLGMGSPGPGLWVVPDAGAEERLRQALADLSLADHAFVWVGRDAAGTDPAAIIDAAWELDDVAARYRRFVDDFRDITVEDEDDTFAAMVRLVHEWRRFPFLDPDLPAELLCREWPGPGAATLFHDLHDRWHRRAHQRWARLEASAARRT